MMNQMMSVSTTLPMIEMWMPEPTSLRTKFRTTKITMKIRMLTIFRLMLSPPLLSRDLDTLHKTSQRPTSYASIAAPQRRANATEFVAPPPRGEATRRKRQKAPPILM